MRLLNTSTKTFYEFACPPSRYAIASHRWGSDELTYEDIKQYNFFSWSKSGYQKLEGFCAQARRDNYQYIWIDSCCIDRSSSAELTEAVNSMFAWYQQATVCYAYLADVDSETDPLDENSKFTKSEWFQRGWTLQELLAPASVIFLAKDWKIIGTRDKLVHRIEQITGVAFDDLMFRKFRAASVAQRMSWAAKRETTRPEDRAYSLMGLFGVHMPTIYGEGENAFKRLQLELMRSSDDQTLFAWSLYGTVHFDDFTSGLLASSPSQFAKHVYQISFDNFATLLHSIGIPETQLDRYKPDFVMINNAVRITLPIKPLRSGLYKALLSCSFDVARPSQPQVPLVIYLERTSARRRQFVRRHLPSSLETLSDDDRSGYVLEEIDVVDPLPLAFPSLHPLTTESLSEIEKMVLQLEDDVNVAGDNDPDRLALLSRLGNSYRSRYEYLHKRDDIDKSIVMLRDVVEQTPDDDPDRPGRLAGLSKSYFARFKNHDHSDESGDIDACISSLKTSLLLTPDDHPDRPSKLASLGDALLERFEHFRGPEDMQNSMFLVLQRAVQVVTDEDPGRAILLDILGQCFARHLEDRHEGTLADLDESISMLENAVRVTATEDAGRPGRLSRLGNALLRRLRVGHLVKSTSVIDRCILLFREALELAPNGHPEKPAMMHKLACALCERFKILGPAASMSDIDEFLSILKIAIRDFPLNDEQTPSFFAGLGNAFFTRFKHNPHDKIISPLKAPPRELPGSIYTPDKTQDDVAETNHRDHQLDVTITLLDKSLQIIEDRHSYKPALLTNLADALITRGNPQDISRAIEMLDNATQLIPNRR